MEVFKNYMNSYFLIFDVGIYMFYKCNYGVWVIDFFFFFIDFYNNDE